MTICEFCQEGFLTQQGYLSHRRSRHKDQVPHELAALRARVVELEKRLADVPKECDLCHYKAALKNQTEIAKKYEDRYFAAAGLLKSLETQLAASEARAEELEAKLEASEFHCQFQSDCVDKLKAPAERLKEYLRHKDWCNCYQFADRAACTCGFEEADRGT